MNVILARHGESKANILKIFSNTGYKHGLTPLGRKQAFNLAKVLTRSFKSFDLIYCSPLKRAVETAEIIANLINIPYKISPYLTEFSVGDLEGRSDSDSWKQYHELWTEWFELNNFTASLPGGESLEEIIIRLKQFFDLIRANNRKHGYQRLLAVSHGGIIRSALPFLVKSPSREALFAYNMKNTGYIVLNIIKSGIFLKSIH